jgi:hypothetical protein
MAKAVVWIGLVEVKPRRQGEPHWREHFGEAAGGFATAVALVTSADEFQRAIAAALTEVGGEAVAFDDVETLESRRAQLRDGNLHEDLVAELEGSGQPQLGVFHNYGAEEFESGADWLESQSESSDLTKLRSQVLRQIAGMLRDLKLPLLGGVNLANEEGRIVVNLTHEIDGGPDLAVSVGDDDVVVGYGLSHAHFGGDGEKKPVDDAYDFIFSALQGRVKIDVWEKADGTIDRTRTSIMVEDGGWESYTADAPSPSPSFDEPPTYTKLLSFASPPSDG